MWQLLVFLPLYSHYIKYSFLSSKPLYFKKSSPETELDNHILKAAGR